MTGNTNGRGHVLSGSHTWMSGPQGVLVPSSSPRHMSRRFDQKHSSWHADCHFSIDVSLKRSTVACYTTAPAPVMSQLQMSLGLLSVPVSSLGSTVVCGCWRPLKKPWDGETDLRSPVQWPGLPAWLALLLVLACNLLLRRSGNGIYRLEAVG